jgi:hypothetical protein
MKQRSMVGKSRCGQAGQARDTAKAEAHQRGQAHAPHTLESGAHDSVLDGFAHEALNVGDNGENARGALAGDAEGRKQPGVADAEDLFDAGRCASMLQGGLNRSGRLEVRGCRMPGADTGLAGFAARKHAPRAEQVAADHKPGGVVRSHDVTPRGFTKPDSQSRPMSAIRPNGKGHRGTPARAGPPPSRPSAGALRQSRERNPGLRGRIRRRSNRG